MQYSLHGAMVITVHCFFLVPATIVQFGSPLSCLPHGANVTMRCTAEGLPKPNVTITSDLSHNSSFVVNTIAHVYINKL